MLPELARLLWLPFLACLILTFIHGYVGLHVLAREVIFVDIALAQVATLGTTAAFLFDYDLESVMAYWTSLGFTLAEIDGGFTEGFDTAALQEVKMLIEVLS